jgi:hypothetical protein
MCWLGVWYRECHALRMSVTYSATHSARANKLVCPRQPALILLTCALIKGASQRILRSCSGRDPEPETVQQKREQPAGKAGM